MFKYPFGKQYPITQHFGENPQMYPRTNGHNGVDFGVPIGTPVFAVTDGPIIKVAEDPGGYGLHIRQRHGTQGVIIYAHLSDVFVKAGDRVTSGFEIGLSGNTGWSTGPHLHLEYRPDGTTAVDILPMLTTPTAPAPTPTPTPEAIAEVVRVTADGLRLRLGPEYDDTKIRGHLNAGDILQVVGVEGEWVAVKLYVHYSFVVNHHSA